MRHRREDVIERTIREFEILDRLVAGPSNEDWTRPLPRPEGKDPWTVKDALVHITYWKADVARSVRKQRRPPDEARLTTNERNRRVYERWRDRSASEVLAWHRQVQADVLAALREAPDPWFSGRERASQWPFDLVGHSTDHRVRDIERALASPTPKGS